MNMNFYVYEHIRNDTGACFYIGKGKGSRCSSSHGRNLYWNKVVNKSNGFKHKIIAANLTEKEAFSFEIAMIDGAKKAGVKLVNVSTGGGGAAGYKHTDQHKDKMKLLMSGASNPMNSLSVRAYQQTQLKEAMNRPEVKAKQSNSRKGMKFSESHIENLRNCHPTKPCVVNGVYYKSLMSASRALNILHGTLKCWMDGTKKRTSKKYVYITECRWI